ncbi:MAG: thiamine phosphate synthase [Hyphomonadaceae bacterium]|nr:thiamine phosphate synthase [Hyphomonadaceae bacterium]
MTAPPAPDACQIYLLTPPKIEDLDVFIADFQAAITAAPVACLQIRLKDASEAEIEEIAKKLIPIAHIQDTLILINDNAYIAARTGADGVHLGQQDMKINLAKTLISDDAIIGITCHNSKDLAFEAGMAGADYVAFGSFFKSETKPEASPADLELLTWWNETMEIPSVAIGGITTQNARSVIEAGANYIALSSGVWDHKDGPAEAVKQLSALCLAHSPVLP